MDLAFNNDLNRDLLKNLNSTVCRDINETSVPFGSKLTSLLLSLMVGGAVRQLSETSSPVQNFS